MALDMPSRGAKIVPRRPPRRSATDVGHNGSVPWLRGAVVLWCRGSKVPSCRGAVVLWFRGSVVPWFHDSVVLWFRGSMVPWWRGSVVQTSPWRHLRAAPLRRHLRADISVRWSAPSRNPQRCDARLVMISMVCIVLLLLLSSC